jgi:drug/metabolite transporter (DMT)-like permease
VNTSPATSVARAESPPSEVVASHGKPEHLLFGTLLGIVSAVGYTSANVCLRKLAEGPDLVWVTCVKAVPTVVVAALFTLIGVRNASRVKMTGRAFAALTAAGLLAHLVGNVGFQRALELLGLALTVPVSLGSMMIGGALIGRAWLGEPVTSRVAAAMGVLFVAICILSLGAHGDSAPALPIETENTDPSRPLAVGAGVVLAALSGISYAALGAVIRHVVGRTVALAPMLLVVSLSGLISLGAWSVARLGVGEMLATGSSTWTYMLGAGILNAVAFFALSKAIHLTSFLHVNLLNASQAALAAAAAVLFFDEKLTLPLCLGLVLTVVGLLLMRRRRGPL